MAATKDRYERLYRIGVELAAERSRDRLVERILMAAKDFCHADGGTIYLVDDDVLRFAIVRTDSLGIAYGGTEAEAPPMPAVPLFEEDGRANTRNVVSAAVHAQESVNIADAYDSAGFDFSGTKAFDARNGYRSTSLLAIPMRNAEGRVIGVLQLINAREGGRDVPFSRQSQEAVEALAFQAAIALDNQQLLEQQKRLLGAFIHLIAAAIDAKSPYTGGHCRRVPELTEMLVEAACRSRDGELASFDLDDDGWYELHIAAWLHDCGKITTPVHVMDKATKLETISDRIETVLARLGAMREAAHRQASEALVSGNDPKRIQDQLRSRLDEVEEAAEFLRRVNVGGEVMADEDLNRLRAIAQWRWPDHAGESRALLTDDELANLSVRKGTLTQHERLVINGHMVETIRMLEALPFPPHLARVPEYAGGHHEKMNGCGYPKGLFAGDMSIPARAMAIADVFEALTAQDRPYKEGMPLSRAMNIMGRMKVDNHLDPTLFDLFVRSGVYRQYAEHHVDAAQIDEVDEAALLALEPKPLELPAAPERSRRWQGFLPEYEAVARTASYATATEGEST
jgi:HD-GYP domain-containing protein (c-di-GMP phosphodiesterase class II)